MEFNLIIINIEYESSVFIPHSTCDQMCRLKVEGTYCYIYLYNSPGGNDQFHS